MPLPVITDAYRVALHWTAADGQTAVNVIHMANATAGDQSVAVGADLNRALGAGIAGSGNHMFATVSSNAVLDGARITPLDGSSNSHDVSVTVNGAGSSEWEPAVAAGVTFYTLTRGRSHRGRVFLPFTAEAEVNSGRVNSSTLTALQSGWDSFHAALAVGSGNGSIFVVASYKLGQFDPVDHIVARRVLHTQRRRQQRVS